MSNMNGTTVRSANVLDRHRRMPSYKLVFTPVDYAETSKSAARTDCNHSVNSVNIRSFV